jgi:hypothetical protein
MVRTSSEAQLMEGALYCLITCVEMAGGHRCQACPRVIYRANNVAQSRDFGGLARYARQPPGHRQLPSQTDDHFRIDRVQTRQSDRHFALVGD